MLLSQLQVFSTFLLTLNWKLQSVGDAENSLYIELARKGDEVVILSLQLPNVGPNILLRLLIVRVTRMKLVQNLSHQNEGNPLTTLPLIAS